MSEGNRLPGIRVLVSVQIELRAPTLDLHSCPSDVLQIVGHDGGPPDDRELEREIFFAGRTRKAIAIAIAVFVSFLFGPANHDASEGIFEDHAGREVEGEMAVLLQSEDIDVVVMAEGSMEGAEVDVAMAEGVVAVAFRGVRNSECD